jgi:general stress protein CsbA
MRFGNVVKVTGMGFAGVILFVVLVVLTLAIGGAFWGWIVMLAWPLFASSTISFAHAFWIGVIVTVVLGALGGGNN